MSKIPWWQPQIGKKEHKIISNVLLSNFPNEGPVTTSFEEKLAALLNVKHVIAVTSCTAGIFISLKAFGIGPGDEVIVPDISFIATANAVEMTGAKAVLVDVDPDTLTIDPVAIDKAITKNTKAIIPVHVSGRGAPMKKILQLAKTHKLAVIEDAAEAFLSKAEGKYLGTIGDTGCFSLSPAKTITTGQGGFIATNNSSLYVTLKQLKDQGRPVRGTGGDDIHYSLGFNFKFTDLQAAVGVGQLSYLQKRIKRMIRNYELYQHNLQNIPEVKVFQFVTDRGAIPQWTDIIAEKRDELAAFLTSHNVDCRKFWHPIHTQSYYKQDDKNFPISTTVAPQVLWLPSAFTLTDRDVQKVCKLITIFYQHEKK
jgi:perosamine synthetase